MATSEDIKMAVDSLPTESKLPTRFVKRSAGS